jgi:hypothetical protein
MGPFFNQNNAQSWPFVVAAPFPSKNQQKRVHNFLTNENECKALRGALCIGQMIKETTSVSH